MTTYVDELITPVEVDWENGDTDTLITLQFDDGTTVTNMITGATGEVFDVANIVGVAASSGERVSATWATKPANIDSDPFSLFKTSTKKQQEYSLNINTASESISIPFTGAYSGTITYSDNTTAAISGTGTYTLDGTTPVKIKLITATDGNGYHLFEFNQTKGNTVTSHTSSLVCTLTGFPVDSGYVRGANGLIEGYQFDGGTSITFPNWTTTGDFSFEFLVDFTGGNSIEIFSSTDNTTRLFRANDNRLYFYVDNIKVLTRPYQYSNSNVKVKVERVSGVYKWYTNGNEISSDVSVNNNNPMAIGKIGGYRFVDLLTTIQLDNGAGDVRNYDFTTGASTKIIETISGNHATIINASTDKWQSVVSKKVFNVKSDGTMDYISARDAILANQDSTVDIINELILFGDCSNAAGTYISNNNLVDQTWRLVAGDNYFKGKFTGYHFNSSGYIYNYDANQKLELYGLQIYSTSINANQGVGNKFYGENIYVDYGFNGIHYFTKGIILVKDSVFKGIKTSIANPNSITKLSFDNVIGIDCAGSYSGNWCTFVSKANFTYTNCVGIFTSNRYNYGNTSPTHFYTGALGSNNVTDDTSAVDKAVGTQDTNLYTYFTDPATNDYTINQTGQTALKGKGWNGTDIVGWAYANAVTIAAAISGTVTSATEADIIAGGKTIVITLTGDTWQPAGTLFDAQRQAIIDGLVSDGAETAGWNNEVKAKEVITSVVRTSDTVLTITLSPEALYNITTQETITTTVPSSSLVTSAVNVIGDITFTITPTASGFNIAWARNANSVIQ